MTKWLSQEEGDTRYELIGAGSAPVLQFYAEKTSQTLSTNNLAAPFALADGNVETSPNVQLLNTALNLTFLTVGTYDVIFSANLAKNTTASSQTAKIWATVILGSANFQFSRVEVSSTNAGVAAGRFVSQRIPITVTTANTVLNFFFVTTSSTNATTMSFDTNNSGSNTPNVAASSIGVYKY